MQTPLVAIFLITLTCGLTLAASISGEPERINVNEELAPYMNIAAKAPSNQAYTAWLRYMMKTNRQQAERNENKRMSDLSAPYMKYRSQDKRNNGVWIWMPAQGYVSVPNQQEEGSDALGKQGKIMRYGK